MKFYKKIIAPFLLLCFTALSFNSSAGMMCSTYASEGGWDADRTDQLLNGVTPNQGCEVGSTNNDKFNVGPDNDELQVNLDEMFTLTTWEVWFKDDPAPDSSSGMYDLSDVGLDADEYNIMVVLKSGNGQEPENYVGYWLDLTGDLMFDFNTPFDNGNGGGGGLSHITFYYSPIDGGGPPDCLPGACCDEGDDCEPDVPEPQTLFTLGLALCGFAFRKKLMS